MLPFPVLFFLTWKAWDARVVLWSEVQTVDTADRRASEEELHSCRHNGEAKDFVQRVLHFFLNGGDPEYKFTFGEAVVSDTETDQQVRAHFQNI